MTVRCPACGHDSDREYRCNECGRDLVDVEESDDQTTVADGSGQYYVQDGDDVVAGPFLREAIATITARAHGTDCAVVTREGVEDPPELLADGGQCADGTERREHLWNDGICPVCGDEFIDGFGPLTEGQSYHAKICIDEKNEETGDGHMLVHLRNVETDTDRLGGRQ